jgi:hypothetical protein
MKDKLTLRLEEAWKTLNKKFLNLTEEGSTENSSGFLLPPDDIKRTPLDDATKKESIIGTVREEEEDVNKPPLMGNFKDCQICSFNEDHWDEDEEEEYGDEDIEEATLPDQLDLEPEKDPRLNRDILKKEIGKYAQGKEVGQKLGATEVDPNDPSKQELIVDPNKQLPATYGDMAGERDMPANVIGKTGINIAKDPDAYLDALKELFLREPTDDELFGQNGKLAKSGDKTTIFYDFTLPAYKGIYYSKKFDDFQMMTTCPSAKECKKFCYARKGSFTQYPKNNLPRSRMLSFIINEPKKFIEKMVNQIKLVSAKAKKSGKKLFFRWHDSGDWFSPTYAKMAFHIATETPDVLHYAYTKQVSMMKSGEAGELPPNFIMNYSYGGKNDELIDKTQDKFSYVIKPEEDLKFPLGAFKKAWKILMDTQTVEKKANSAYKKANSAYRKAIKMNSEDLHLKTSALELAKENLEKCRMNTITALKKVDKECMNDTFRLGVESLLNLPRGSVITYFEMVDMPEDPNKDVKWNVLVYPGCGDVSAARKDVAGTLLLIH